MGGESEEEEEDEQNSLSYIYDARYHVNPYILSTTVLSDYVYLCERGRPPYKN